MTVEDAAEWAAREKRAMSLFEGFVREHREELRLVAHFGDGRCGALLMILQEELLSPNQPRESGRKKGFISRGLAKRVFELDAYRCVTCGGFEDLTCDHIIPEAKGGPATFENLQTMCRSCNSRKGTKDEGRSA